MTSSLICKNIKGKLQALHKAAELISLTRSSLDLVLSNSFGLLPPWPMIMQIKGEKKKKGKGKGGNPSPKDLRNVILATRNQDITS